MCYRTYQLSILAKLESERTYFLPCWLRVLDGDKSEFIRISWSKFDIKGETGEDVEDDGVDISISSVSIEHVGDPLAAILKFEPITSESSSESSGGG